MPERSMKILAGHGDLAFAERVARRLGKRLIETNITHSTKRQSSISMSESVRDDDVYIIQSPRIQYVNSDLVDLLILVNACRAASAYRIHVILPSFPYARQDKKDKSRAPITAKLCATMLQTAGCDHVITMDLHASQIQGFFTIPVDNLYASPSVVRYIEDNMGTLDAVIVSPDAGGAKRATALADRLNLPFALIHKERARPGQISRMVLVGSVEGKAALIVDDMADTCGTLVKAAKVLKEGGAKTVSAIVTHGILSGKAVENLNGSDLTSLIVANTVPLEGKLESCSILRVIDVAPVFAEACRRTHNGESLSALFDRAPLA